MLNKITDIIDLLKDGGVDSPRLEANMLIDFVGQGKELELFSDEEKTTLKHMIEKRLAKMPLCKIMGTKGFYKYDFFVSEDVLSPRPDTEVLVEKAISYLEKEKLLSPNVLEFGLGSGCVLLSIISEFSKGRAVGLEFSEKAILVAQKNVSLLKQEEKVEIVQGSWFDENLLYKLGGQKFDMIVSNPPYIPSCDIDGLEQEVKGFDPLLALDGGLDGLRDYRQIAKASRELLKEEGYILLEIGINQTKDVVEIFEKQGFNLQEICKDLAGIERCIIFKK